MPQIRTRLRFNRNAKAAGRAIRLDQHPATLEYVKNTGEFAVFTSTDSGATIPDKGKWTVLATPIAASGTLNIPATAKQVRVHVLNDLTPEITLVTTGHEPEAARYYTQDHTFDTDVNGFEALVNRLGPVIWYPCDDPGDPAGATTIEYVKERVGTTGVADMRGTSFGQPAAFQLPGPFPGALALNTSNSNDAPLSRTGSNAFKPLFPLQPEAAQNTSGFFLVKDQPFTVSLFFKLNVAHQVQDSVYWYMAHSGGSNGWIWVDSTDTNEDLRLVLNNNDDINVTFTGAPGLVADDDRDWHHIVVTFDQGGTDQARLYLDGVDVAGGDIAGNALLSDATNVQMGMGNFDNGDNRDVDADFAHWVMFPKALSAVQVAELFAASGL